jgi:hypothetical protein
LVLALVIVPVATELPETLNSVLWVRSNDDMLAFGAYGAGPSGTLPPDASPQSRLLDWFGRRP